MGQREYVLAQWLEIEYTDLFLNLITEMGNHQLLVL